MNELFVSGGQLGLCEIIKEGNPAGWDESASMHQFIYFIWFTEGLPLGL